MPEFRIFRTTKRLCLNLGYLKLQSDYLNSGYLDPKNDNA